MMNEFSEQVFEELTGQLESFGGSVEQPVVLLKGQLALVGAALGRLSDTFLQQPFDDPVAEVNFYKLVYPRFKSLTVYYTERHHFFAGVPASGAKFKKKYYLSKLRDIAGFFERNSLHYDYFQIDGSLLDELFYTRRDPSNVLQPFVLGYEPFLGTAMGELVSFFMAYERLRNEILALLHGLSAPAALSATVVDVVGSLHRSFKWTGEDIHLIELVHGIHLTGQVNNGDIGIVELFRVVGAFFGVNLRVPRRGFDDLKKRYDKRQGKVFWPGCFY